MLPGRLHDPWEPWTPRFEAPGRSCLRVWLHVDGVAKGLATAPKRGRSRTEKGHLGPGNFDLQVYLTGRKGSVMPWNNTALSAEHRLSTGLWMHRPDLTDGHRDVHTRLLRR